VEGKKQQTYLMFYLINAATSGRRLLVGDPHHSALTLLKTRI